MPYKSENVGMAFLLVTAAGASTAIGAAVVFFPRLVKLASRRVLAGSLGFSAGVMAYVSFIEIFQKARIGFEDAGLDEGKAYSYATLCFFGGVVVMMVRIYSVYRLIGSCIVVAVLILCCSNF
jgi:ZIP family zinc transporter